MLYVLLFDCHPHLLTCHAGFGAFRCLLRAVRFCAAVWQASGFVWQAVWLCAVFAARPCCLELPPRLPCILSVFLCSDRCATANLPFRALRLRADALGCVSYCTVESRAVATLRGGVLVDCSLLPQESLTVVAVLVACRKSTLPSIGPVTDHRFVAECNATACALNTRWVKLTFLFCNVSTASLLFRSWAGC